MHAGFHSGSSGSPIELATPLLFANILRWLKPRDIPQPAKCNAGTVGLVTVRSVPINAAQFKVT